MHLQNLAARHPTQSAAGLQPLDIASDLRHVQTPPRLDARERALDDWTRLARMGSPRGLASPRAPSEPLAYAWLSAGAGANVGVGAFAGRGCTIRGHGAVRTSSVETEPNSTRSSGP